MSFCDYSSDLGGVWISNEARRSDMDDLKARVASHWEDDVCGSRYGDFQTISRLRYENHPWLEQFADFPSARDKDVLEVGLGTGADFERWISHGARVTGIDLTQASVRTVRSRLSAHGISEDAYVLQQGDAEDLPFSDESFDMVYSFGVLHHTPDTRKAIEEAVRVLRSGGTLKIMIYHLHSWSVWMVWLLSIARGEFVSPRSAVYRNLESPGTKAYTKSEVLLMLKSMELRDITVTTKLVHSDFLNILPSKRHDNRFFRIAKAVYPRVLVRMFGDRFGLDLLIEAKKR